MICSGGSDTGAGPSDEGSSGYQSDSARSREIDPKKVPVGLSGLLSGVTKTFETTVGCGLSVHNVAQ